MNKFIREDINLSCYNNIRQQKVYEAAQAIEQNKNTVILETLSDILGEDFPVKSLSGRVKIEMRAGLEYIILDGKEILVFHSVDSHIKDNGNTLVFTQNYRRIK